MTVKKLIHWLPTKLRMMRVGRGFTVHSPFAYHFIRCCLRERLPYYAFKREVTTPARQRLFRVAAYFCPATVSYVGDSAEARRIISLACPRAREVDAAADLTYVASGAPLPADFRVLYAEDAPDALLPAAMTFTNGRTLIAVRRPGLPPQPIRLPF